jgi:hypothetical protein
MNGHRYLHSPPLLSAPLPPLVAPPVRPDPLPLVVIGVYLAIMVAILAIGFSR